MLYEENNTCKAHINIPYVVQRLKKENKLNNNLAQSLGE